jgi:hypothetical protein
MKQVVYKGSILAKGSQALELWEDWQKAKADRNKFQKKLDDHMKQLDANARDLVTRYESVQK